MNIIIFPSLSVVDYSRNHKYKQTMRRCLIAHFNLLEFALVIFQYPKHEGEFFSVFAQSGHHTGL